MADEAATTSGMMPFIFGGSTGTASYEELKRRQAVALALASQKRAFPKTLGEGMTYFGEAIGERMAENRMREMEKAQRATDAAGARTIPGGSYRTGDGPAPAVAAPAPQAFFADPDAAPQEVAQGNPTLGGPMVPPGSPSDGEVISDAAPIGGPGDQLALSKTAAPYAPAPLPTSLSPRVPEQPPAALAPEEEPEPTPTSIRPAPVQVAQTGPGGLPSSMFNLPPPAFGGAPAAPAVRVDAFPAPAGGPAAPNSPPSREAIPPASREVFPDYGPEPKPPSRLGPSPAAQGYWRVMNDPRYSDDMRSRAQKGYENEERFRLEIQSRQQEEYRDKRERWQAFDTAAKKHTMEADTREIKQRIDRLQIEEAAAKAENRPLDRAKLQAEIANSQADLNRKLYEQGQRPVAERKAAAETTSAEQTAAAGKAPPHITVDKKVMVWDPESKSFKPLPPQPKGPGAPDVELSETQSKTFHNLQTADIGFEQYKRVPDADKILAEGLRDELAGKLPFFSNAALSSRYRRARNAALQVADAQLREVSGASIGVAEEAKAIARLFPVFGDDPGTTRQKAEIRDGIVTGMKLKLGAKGGELADYARGERDKHSAAEQAKIEVEMKDAPKIIGKIYKDGNKRRYWTGSRWEDD